MTYDIRDTMFEAICRAWVDCYPPSALYISDLCLSVIDNHLANEPRTKAETALIEFAEGKAHAIIARGDNLLRSSCEIPREILQAFVEELGK